MNNFVQLNRRFDNRNFLDRRETGDKNNPKEGWKLIFEKMLQRLPPNSTSLKA